MDNLYYLAAPYSHADLEIVKLRYKLINACFAILLKRGYIVFSPISSSHVIAYDHNMPRDWTFWERLDLAIMERCDSLFVLKLDGWLESCGVSCEVEYAKKLNMPIEYIHPTDIFKEEIFNVYEYYQRLYAERVS